MKALVQLKNPITYKESEVIRSILSPIFDIHIMDIDLGKGTVLFSYNGLRDLMMAEKMLMDIGLPIISYSYPDRTPLGHSGTSSGHSSLA